MTMPVKVLSLMLVAALPLAGCGSTTTTGAAGGAVAGAVVGGPVGAVVGGVVGVAVGAALSPEETTRVRTYVVQQRRPSYTVRDEVVEGYRVPRRVTLYVLPRESGFTTHYRYAVINQRVVLVDPNTREIIEILD